jgi:multimeric flavodoxin WrbA
MNNPIIIFGSSRSDGETAKVVKEIIGQESNIPVIDLSKLNITPYDYQHRNKNDDYIPLIKQIITHDLIILATPIYWYSVSAQMKIFIDRLSDLITYAKELGRNLRGKRLFVISSFNTSIPRNFEEPIKNTCEYMGIKYEGCSFICSGTDPELIKQNIEQISKAKNMVYNKTISAY